MNPQFKLQADLALARGINSIMADRSLLPAGREGLLKRTSTGYAVLVGISEADADSAVAKILKRKTDETGQGELGINPGPAEAVNMIGKAEALTMTRSAIAEETAEIRKANPHLTESQARERVYGVYPGLRRDLTEMSGREYGRRGPSQDIAKADSVTSAQIEAVAKAAERRLENPRLSEHQALTRVYEAEPTLLKRLMTDHGPPGKRP